jgi:hypothetical protein
LLDAKLPEYPARATEKKIRAMKEFWAFLESQENQLPVSAQCVP